MKTVLAGIAAAYAPAIYGLAGESINAWVDHHVLLRHAVRYISSNQIKEEAVRHLKEWLKIRNIPKGTRFAIMGPEYEDYDQTIGYGIQVGPKEQMDRLMKLHNTFIGITS